MSDSQPSSATPVARFADQLTAAIDRVDSPACIGLDPVWERLPESVRDAVSEEPEGIERFCNVVIDAVAQTAAVVKPQSACFERYGSEGVAVLERVISRARSAGLLVVLDAKRGDIGVSAAHYAAAAAGMGAHAITVNGYLGPGTVEPFLAAGLGVFVLVRTSNPDSDAVQSVELASGDTMAEHMGGLVHELGTQHVGERGLSGVGAVVGATKASADGSRLRARMPDAPLLVPGVGAQGGTVDDIRDLCRSGARSMGELGVVVNASRSVLFPETQGASWNEAVQQAAERFAAMLRALHRA